MRPNTATIAARIIGRSDRGHPADGLLRKELKATAGISAEQSKELSYAVFSYFRWRAWLPPGRPIAEQIEEALHLAEVYASSPGSFNDADLIARTVPAWVAEEVELTSAWARVLQTEPKLWLRARPGKGRGLALKLTDARIFGKGVWADTIEYFGQRDLFRTSEFHSGEFEIQDLSSQAVGLICGAKAGETWWDACTGQGGKLLHLSDLMANQGLIWASDRSDWRLRKLKHRAARARAFNFRSKLWDGGPRLPTKTLFDGILVDAPCSGLGTWQRNPHARWTASPDDVRELASVQKRLLANASKALKPGGRLVYSVCTLTRTETREVVKAFEAGCPELEPFPVRNPLQPESPSQHGVLIRGEEFGGNSMFVAAWVRRGGSQPAA